MPVVEPAEQLTDDAALGGRLRLLQPRRGHRFGHDAILLAAATPARSGDRVADLGAGVGAAGLALAARVPGARITLVEIDQRLAALAAGECDPQRFCGLRRCGRARCRGIVRRFRCRRPRCGKLRHRADEPAFPRQRPCQASPDPRRRGAHSLDAADLAGWVAAAQRLLRPGGILTLIFRADGVPVLLDRLAGGFGAIALLPVHPKPGAAAIRVLLAAVKASRGPLAILPGLVLAQDDGTPTAQAEAVLRHGAALALIAR